MLSQVDIIIQSSDRNIPYDLTSPGVRGAGPHDSLINLLWYYYEQKPNVIARWVEQMDCGGAETYPTVSTLPSK